MDIAEIQDLIKFVAKSGVREVEIEQKDFKIVIKSDAADKKRGRKPELEAQIPTIQVPVQGMPALQQVAVAPAPAPAPVAVAPAPAAPEESNNYVEIKSPMIGTFYRSAGPDKPPFVAVGDEIKPGDVVCIVEAMKLFNEIEAEVSGKVVKILVDDNSPIQYDQPLLLIDPS